MNRSRLAIRAAALCRRVALPILSMCAFAPGVANAAAYATGGVGAYRPQVLWLTWGGGVNGTANATLADGATSTAALTINGVPLNVSCALSNIRLSNNTPVNVRAYRSGDFTSDAFDDLYNIGGTGGANQLIAGIANVTSGQNVLFTMTCSATLNGLPYDLPGVVISDAEASLSIQNEYVQGSADGVWQVIERYRTAGCMAGTNATLSQAGTIQTLRLSGSASLCASGPDAVTFLTFNPTAFGGANRQVSLDVNIQGGGVSAVALGLFAPTADWSDAPASYGPASHLFTPAFTADSLAVGQTLDVFGAGFTLSQPAAPTTDKIGTLLDSDGISLAGNAAADADDTTGVDDEDSVGALAPLTALMDGLPYAVPLQCTGTGGVAGWIDFNVDGDFLDANERSTNTPTCAAGGGTVNLAFTLPSGAALVAGQSYLRVRYAQNPGTVLITPSGQAPTGEVEDHAITILAPSVTITKITNGAVGTFNFTQSNTTPGTTSITTTAIGGAGTAGAPAAIVAPGTGIVVTETAAAGWALTGITCTKSTGGTFNPVYDIPNRQVTIAAADVDTTASFACTFTNQRLRTVTVNKTLTPASDTGLFNLQVNGTDVATNVGNGGSGSNATVAVGSTVAVAELAGTGTALPGYASTLACTGVGGVTGTTSGSFTMPDNDVTCTFSNAAIVNLAITKSATPNGTYLPGQPLTYTITVTNNGPRAASGISVSDTVPASVAVATWSCAASGAGADCDTGAAGTGATGTGNAIALNAVALGAGQSLTITVNGTVQLATTGTIVNTATASPPAGATCTTLPCTVSSTTTNGDAGAPQITLTKTATPGAFAVGQAATYTLQVSNTGSSSTVGAITISDPLPAGITTTALPSGSGWNCAASTTTVVNCTTNAVLLPGSNAPPISVPVTVAVGTASPAVNTATASGGGDTSCPAAAHCVGTTTTPVNAPRLDVVKSLSGNFVVGVETTYVIAVTNNGTAPTIAGGTISDTIPNGLTIGTLPAGCTAAAQVVTCAIPAGLAPGASVSFTTPVTPQGTALGQSLTNNATASGGGDPSCPAATHCTGTTTDVVQAPQLSIVKSATPTTFVVGQPATYTLTVTNTGTAATTAAATVTDTVPTGLTIGTLPAGCSASGQVVTCTIAAGLATGTPVSFAIPVVATAALNGISVTNNATVAGGGDPSCPVGAPNPPARCTGSVTTPVDAPQLTIAKAAGAANFVVGVASNYTLTVTNTGTAATTAAASVVDVIPADLTIGTLPAGCTATGQQVTCTIAAGLAVGANVAFVIPVTPLASANGQTLSNSATVSGGGDPTCPGQAHCGATTTTPVNAPSLSVVKSASGSNFVVGVPASYTITVTNTGTAATTAPATVNDTIPSSLTVGAMPAGCSNSGQVVTCTIPAGLAVGAPVGFVIPVTPQASASGTTVSNRATVSGGGDPDCPAAAECSSTTDTPVDAPQLSIAKTASGANFVVGVPASYTITVTNTGTAATTAVATISDTLPGDLSPGAMPAGCANSGQVVTCTIAAGLATGAPVSFVIPVTPLASASGQTLTNTATATGGGDPTCPGAAHCTGGVDVPVNAPKLVLTKTASGANFVVGVPSSYTLGVTNAGSAATTADATISDTLPAGLTPGTMPAGCSNSGQVVTCTIPAGFATGALVSFVIPVTPQPSASGSTLANTATVSGGGDPTCPQADDCNGTTDTPVDAPNLTIAKTASGTSFVVGVPASYTLTVTNTGTAATTADASVSDTVPASLTLGAMPAGCSSSGQVVTCTIPAGLATGTPVSFVIPVTPQASASGSTLTNDATVSGGGDPTCPGAADCTATTNTPVGAPKLTIAKTASGANFVVGVPASYTLAVTNTGSAATTAIAQVSDTVPAGLTLGAMPAGCSNSGQVVTCAIAAGLAPGALVSFVIPVTPQASASGSTLTNSATVSGGGDPTCPGAADCTATTDTPVDAPKLTIAKTASGASFVVGVPASYTLTVTNTGTAATTQPASISDTVPAGLTLGAMPAGCSSSGQVVTCTIPAGFASGALASFTIPVTPQASTSGTTVTNNATVSGGGDPTCPAAADCTATTNTPVNAPQLSITKAASVASFVVGVPASYTLTVTNTGTAATTQPATVSDTVPAGLAIGAVPAGCTNSGQVVTCTIPAGLATGAPVGFVIPVTPLASANGQTLSNSATVSGGGDPTCPQAPRCTSVVQTPVNAPALAIVKTASATAFVVNVPASYTLTVTNAGSAATTTAAAVNDTLPAGLTLGAMPAGCSNSGQVVTCTIAAGFAAGASTAFTIPVTPTAAASGTTLTNSATVSGGGDPACPQAARCTGTVGVPVDAPQLTLVKTASTTTFIANQPATYTLTVTNTGSAATTAPATVTDPLPDSLTPGTMPADCSATGQQVTCTIAAGLAVNASVVFVVPVTPTQAAAGTTIVNTATVTGGGDPSCPGAPHCVGTTTVLGAGADLAIVKTHAGTTVLPGGTIVYTLAVTNAGPSDAANLVVSDPLPAGLAYVSATGTGWTCAEAAGVVTCNSASLAAGATSAITLTLSVPANYHGAVAIANVASVSSTTPDPNPNNNTGTDTISLASQILPVPALGWPALAAMVLMLVGFAWIMPVGRRRLRRAR